MFAEVTGLAGSDLTETARLGRAGKRTGQHDHAKWSQQFCFLSEVSFKLREARFLMHVHVMFLTGRACTVSSGCGDMFFAAVRVQFCYMSCVQPVDRL